jgi:hypothetical protein
MSVSSSEQKSEARRALSVLSRDEQRELMQELELEEGTFVFFIPKFGRITLGRRRTLRSIIGRADPQMRMMLLVVLGLLAILVILLVMYIITLFIGKTFDEHLFTLMSAIIGYLAGVIVKPTLQQRKEESTEE